MNLTQDQERYHAAAVEFGERYLTGDMVERDRDQTFERSIWQECADFGLMKMPIPPEYGGLGLGLSDLIATMEGLGYGGRDLGLLFSIHAHMWTAIMPILKYGSEEQKQAYLGKLGDGTWIAANTASEPDSGSDIFSLRTRAEKIDEGYVLTGSKTFVTNAQVADVFVTYATIDPGLGPMGVTGFLVDRDTEGLTVSKKIEKMGLRTSPMGEVIFENCSIGEEKRLGREGRGAGVFDSSMEWERGCILASCVGAMQRQLEASISHVRQRSQFGQPIGKFQSVANRIVEMKIRVDTCRPLVYRIGELMDAGKSARMEAAIAKLHIAECFAASSLDAMRNLGGYAYMTEQEAERDLRDALGGLFYSGTSDIQRNIIARSLGL